MRVNIKLGLRKTNGGDINTCDNDGFDLLSFSNILNILNMFMCILAHNSFNLLNLMLLKSSKHFRETVNFKNML